MTKSTSTKAAGQETPTLRQRAAQARDAAGRFLRRAVGQPADQPEPASLPGETAAEGRADAFPAAGAAPHDAGRGQPDGSGRADAARGQEPRQGQTMGRHETFENAAPIAAELLAGTSLGRLSSPLQPDEVSPQEAAFLAVIPKALPILRRLIPAQAERTRLDVEADAAAGGYPGLTDEGRRRTWADRASDARKANGYSAAWKVANDLDDELTALVEDYDLVPMRSSTAILFKAALNDLGEWWGESATADLCQLAAARFGLPASNDPTAVDATDEIEEAAAPAAVSEPVDWRSPPPGFMAYPTDDPQQFVIVREGLRLELERLHRVALAEYARKVRPEADDVTRARVRRELRLGVFEAASPNGDAEILALGVDLDDAHARWRAATPGFVAAQAHVCRAMAEAKARGGPTQADSRAAWSAPGISEANDMFEDIGSELERIAKAIWRTPARTSLGLAVKARATLVMVFTSGQYERDSGLGEDEDLQEQAARALIEACCALAGVDWTGRPLGGGVGVPAMAPLALDVPAEVVPAFPYPERAWAVAQGALVDLSGLDVRQLANAYDMFAVMADHWLDAINAPWAEADPDSPCTSPNAAGRLLTCEQERAAEIRDRINAEIGRRVTTGEYDRDRRLETLIRHELLCNGNLASEPGLRAEIAVAWGG